MKIYIKLLFIFFSFIQVDNLYSQTDIYPNTSLNGQLFSTCNGVLYSSGGVLGYQDNEDWIITICPDVLGNAIQLNFNSFNLDTTNTALLPINNADKFYIMMEIMPQLH